MSDGKVIEVLAKELREQLDFMYGNNLPIEYSRAVVRRALSEAGLEIVQKDRWQDIETAPKLGVNFIAWGVVDTETGNWNTCICYYHQNFEQTEDVLYGWSDHSAPTHWQPLPSKPQG